MNTQDDRRFDDAMRDLHRAALGNISPGVAWKLRPAAPARPAVRPRGWRMGAAFAGAAAALFAVALGVGIWPQRAVDTAPTMSATVDADDTALGQDPDFYAWLASDDAALVAME